MTVETLDLAIEYERSRDDQVWARWLARCADALLLSPITFLLFVALGLAVELGRVPAEVISWVDNPILAAIVVFFLLMALLGASVCEQCGNDAWKVDDGHQGFARRAAKGFRLCGRYAASWLSGWSV
jgi:hypothetical protein